jgi:hypothetical protein
MASSSPCNPSNENRVILRSRYENNRMNPNTLNLCAVSLRLFICLAALAVSARSQAQILTNPSFENHTFTVAPGTISANSAIAGWSAADNTKAGLSPAGALNAFANNGVIPNGTNVLFVQPTNTVSTVISGLEIGSNYMLRFRANAQNAQRPNLRVALDTGTLFDAGGVGPVGAGGQYHYVALPFTATAASHTLFITNNTTMAGLTNVLLLDNFSIGISNSGWSVANWTNDASSGVDGSKVYTHAYAFNVTGVPFTINGVPFTRTGAGVVNPTIANELATVNLGSATTDAGNVIKTAAGGSSSNLAHGFVYNGNPAIFELLNLIPGKEYVATIYSVGFDAVGASYGRSVTFASGNDRLSVNQDQYGDNQGIRVSFRYTAPASGSFTFSNIPFSTAVGTFHTYGLANYEVVSETVPVIGVQPVSKASVPGASAAFVATASGVRPLAYRWLKDGVEISGQTNRILGLTNLTSADLASYALWVSNSLGMVTSSVATLTFDTAQIPNPSFETDQFTFYPGYISGNSPITGWSVNNPLKVGLQPLADGLSPFGNNGTVPDGANVAFIQSTGSLSTTISGLVSNQVYSLQFRANGRATQRANLIIAINNQTVLDTLHNPVTGTNAYRFVSLDFTAPDTNALLTLSVMTNYYAGDHSVLVDNFTIAPSTSRWSYAMWTNDASSGVDPTKLYTHAFGFGAAGADTAINGVLFRRAPGVNPSVSGFFATAGFGSTTADPGNVITTAGGGGAGLSTSFIYGGALQTITLSNLLPGTEYVASIYTIAWDIKGFGRSATFFVGSDRMTINQDHFGNDQGNVISYRYTAPSNGTLTLSYVPTDTASTIHTYAFANRVANDSAPVIGAQPQNLFVPIGSTNTLTVGLSAGSLPMYFQWQLNGVDILDATNSTLTLSNLNAYGTGGYQVIITNFLGAATSVVATVEVGARIAELFNTGADNNNYFLPGGIVDAHYQLVSSPDPNYPGPVAITMHNGAFPLLANYFTNGLFSSWISPRTNDTVGNSNGYYFYRTAFIMDTTDPTRAQINGRWASDNEGIDIRLNGASLGISNMVSGAFTKFYPFTITNGFIAGSNIIEFVISNGPATGPTALRVEMTGVAQPLSNSAPVIINSPTDRTVVEGSGVTFAVMASGSGPLTYQWYYEGFDLIDETNRTLRLNNVTVIDHPGHYYCTVSNGEGSTNSTEALLTVTQPTVIVTPPAAQNVECGSNATFTVVADGTGPFSYQWLLDGGAITDATNASLLVPDAHGVAGYSVVVCGVVNCVTSAPVYLTAADTIAPTVTCPGDIIVFTSSNSRPVSFSFSATDGCDTNLTVWSAPSSGNAFALGTNTVLVVASDSSFNTNTCSFTIVVLSAASPAASGTSLTGTNSSFTFGTQNGLSYRVESTDTLTPPAWMPLLTVIGDGSIKTITDTNAVTAMRFYRIIVE